MTGFDDYLWFMLGTQVGRSTPATATKTMNRKAFARTNEKPSPYLAQTLVESLPPNFGVEENLSAELRRRQLSANLPARAALSRPAHDRLSGTAGTTSISCTGGCYTEQLPIHGHLAQDGFDVKVFDTMGLRGQTGHGGKCWVSALAVRHGNVRAGQRRGQRLGADCV
jgi:hypothetical protein